MKLILFVDMHCKGCENTIKNVVLELKGIKSVKADYTENKVIVEFDEKTIEKDKMVKEVEMKIKDAGYKIDKVYEEKEEEGANKKSFWDIFK